MAPTIAWRANDFAIVANGGTPALDTSGALAGSPVRLMIGAAPYIRPPEAPTAVRPSARLPTIPSDRRSLAWRWYDVVAGLAELQAQYASLAGRFAEQSAGRRFRQVLRAICDLNITELQTIEPPRGVGRD